MAVTVMKPCLTQFEKSAGKSTTLTQIRRKVYNHVTIDDFVYAFVIGSLHVLQKG